MTVTVIAAVLAGVLTLVLATALNDLAPTPTPTGGAATPPPPQATTASPGWAPSPFKPLLSAPGDPAGSAGAATAGGGWDRDRAGN